MILYVKKFIPQSMYGFLGGMEEDIFFHLADFHPISNDVDPAPPILGEEVEVELEDGTTRATRVQRLTTPTPQTGKVDWFDAAKGFGFIEMLDGEKIFLHRSEIKGRKVPRKDDPVSFYPGCHKGKPRACHVSVQ